MNHNQIVVVKVGGSLLKSRGLAERLRDWLAARSGESPQVHLVFVVGGGPWADRVRELDAHSAIGIERAHWACIEIMDVTAGLLAAMLPDLSVVTSFDDLQRRVEVPGTTIFKPGEFMLRFEPNSPGTKLPASWDVTSDSIAARLAVVLNADQLVLLKSALPPTGSDPSRFLANWSVASYVDAFLPCLAHELPAMSVVQLT